MQLGMIGLGRMGANMVRRLMRNGIEYGLMAKPTPPSLTLRIVGGLSAGSSGAGGGRQ